MFATDQKPASTVVMDIRRPALIRSLLGIACTLTLLSVAANGIRLHYDLHPRTPLRLFDVDTESSLPTYYSCLLLLGCSLALAANAKAVGRHGGKTHYWKVLAAGFLLMSIDEVAAIHERTSHRLTVLLNGIPHPENVWTVAGAAVALVVFFYFLPFLWRLPARTRWQFVISGAIFVGGAVGVEIPEGEYQARFGPDFVSDLIKAGEEMMEMGGAILFLSALLAHLEGLNAAITLRVTGQPAPIRVRVNTTLSVPVSTTVGFPQALGDVKSSRHS